MIKYVFFLSGIVSFLSLKYCHGQNRDSSDTTQLTLQDCISYALKHQPALEQSLIDESVAHVSNSINLSYWLPQANIGASIQHYFQLPVAFIPNINSPDEPKLAEATGVYNLSTPFLSASETVFSPDVLYAAKTAHLNTRQAEQATTNTKINLVADISKAFYDLLLTRERVIILQEDTARLKRNLQDTYHQYVGGITDKVDYKEASISLNNSIAQLKLALEDISPKCAQLKQLMGYPLEKQFTVFFDTSRMMSQISLDTTQPLDFNKRIELQQVQTRKYLQEELTDYYRWQFLPTVAVSYEYNYAFQNDKFQDLFAKAYPNSFIELTASIPIFQGMRRVLNIRKSKLLEEHIDWDEVNTRYQIYTEYRQAMAGYKSNLFNLHALMDNVSLAKDVYNVVMLQYKQGIKTYLNVITAETDLITSEINYTNALFQLLSSKIDLEKAMGNISTNP